jgi:hypothetical protein
MLEINVTSVSKFRSYEREKTMITLTNKERTTRIGTR